MTVFIIDNSNSAKAGGWVSDCVPGNYDTIVVQRKNIAKDVDYEIAEFVILTGSEHSVFEDNEWTKDELVLIKQCAKKNIPLLGICFGHQLIIRAFYGKEGLRRREIGELDWRNVFLKNHPLFKGLNEIITPYSFHFDEANENEIPDFDILASSELCKCHAICHKKLPMLGVQFHPEIQVRDGMVTFYRHEALIKGSGVDFDGVIASSKTEKEHYYPQIIRNFMVLYDCST